ncbi:Sec-independent protein translocase subunit TatA/TatB [Planctomicrobium sp. SH661]|uniref:Sec-independent protein translocase subunit TatA/TatB n=1 Tax=Planctomicrobium sp. SH661 TaxID=3448124 RepID=UPI003F5AE980
MSGWSGGVTRPCIDDAHSLSPPISQLLAFFPRQNTLGVAMFGLGVPELVILAVIILLLFGRRLPGLFLSLGQSVPAFKKGLADGETPSSSSES